MHNKVKTGNRWDLRYSEPGFAYGTSPNDFLVDSISYLSTNGSVFCLAEGEGRNGVWLARKGYSVTAVDSSTVGLQKAQELASRNGVDITTHLADLGDYTFPGNTFDGIIAIFCHLPPLVRRKTFNALSGSLKKGGTLLLEGYSKRQLEFGTGGPPSLEMLYDLEEICEELTGFDFLLAREIERDIHEGTLHNGRGSVIQIIGKKRAA